MNKAMMKTNRIKRGQNANMTKARRKVSKQPMHFKDKCTVRNFTYSKIQQYNYLLQRYLTCTNSDKRVEIRDKIMNWCESNSKVAKLLQIKPYRLRYLFYTGYSYALQSELRQQNDTLDWVDEQREVLNV